MGTTSLHRVVIYHDETKDVPGRNFKGHVVLFVPVELSMISETPLLGIFQEQYSPLKLLARKIDQIRQEYNCDGKLHFSEISGRMWGKYDSAYRKVVDLAVDALRKRSPEIFRHPLNCKVAAIFYPKGADWNIYPGESRKEQILKHDETLLRILLKGACHYLYDESNPVEITMIISDGHPEYRQLDVERIVWRLTYDDFYGRSPVRDYVSFASDAGITHMFSDHKNYQCNTEEYMHANLLQVADLLLGSIMRACYVGFKTKGLPPKIGECCEKRDVIAYPVREMLNKKKRGAGFRNSGHFKSFSITEVTFTHGGIAFKEPSITPFQDDQFLQMSFSMSDNET